MPVMRIDLHDENRRHLMWVEIDPASPPRVVHGRGPRGPQERYLEWERVFDDEGHLRRCPACGCTELYHRSSCPPLTGFVVVLVVALICLALWGFSDAPLELVVGVLVVLAIANVLISVLAPKYLGCYACQSRYFGAGVSRDRRDWDAAVAEKYRKEPAAVTSGAAAGSEAGESP